MQDILRYLAQQELPGKATMSCSCTINPNCSDITRPTSARQSAVEIKVEHSEWRVEVPFISRLVQWNDVVLVKSWKGKKDLSLQK